jgi:hypothetical protein
MTRRARGADLDKKGEDFASDAPVIFRADGLDYQLVALWIGLEEIVDVLESLNKGARRSSAPVTGSTRPRHSVRPVGRGSCQVVGPVLAHVGSLYSGRPIRGSALSVLGHLVAHPVTRGGTRSAGLTLSH